MRVGFAALWDRPRAATWSHVPLNLLTAMQAHGDVIDLDIELPPPARLAARALGARWNDGRPVTLWRSEGLTDVLVERRVRAAALSADVDVVFEMADLATPEVPFVSYRDVYWGQIEALVERGHAPTILGHPGMSRARLRRRREREDALLRSAAAVVTFSHWSASYLLDELTLPTETVHVLRPGINVTVGCAPGGPTGQNRLLFVGRDFERKGGPLLLEAFEIVRRRRPDATLTIAGPSRLRQPIPDGVDFVGPLSTEAVAEAFTSHDLFVMPSAFEPFGIAFVEALAAGLPCIVPDRCAAPEIISDSVTGRLVGSDRPEDWADAIVDTLGDTNIFENTTRAARAATATYEWCRAGRDAVRICHDALHVTTASTSSTMPTTMLTTIPRREP
jgi:glycosyltransferase involved in cell wall biosynthesis